MSHPIWFILSVAGWLCVITSLVLYGLSHRGDDHDLQSRAPYRGAPALGSVTSSLFVGGSALLALSLLYYG